MMIVRYILCLDFCALLSSLAVAGIWRFSISQIDRYQWLTFGGLLTYRDHPPKAIEPNYNLERAVIYFIAFINYLQQARDRHIFSLSKVII